MTGRFLTLPSKASDRETSRASRPQLPGRQSRLEFVGPTLLGAAGAWTLLSADELGDSAGAMAAAFLGAAGALVLARLVASKVPSLVPTIVLALAGILAVHSREDLFSGTPSSVPFGYANASAAFFVQATIAALLLVATSRRRSVRFLGAAGAGVFIWMLVRSDSLAASVLAVAVPGAALLVRAIAGHRAAVVLCGGMFAMALAGTLALAAASDPAGGGSRDVAGTAGSLPETRIALWGEAWRIMSAHPATGVGPGRFREASPTARSDADLRWAHHEFLQQGAETGAVGFALLVLLFLWGFGRLSVVPIPDDVTVLGATSLAVLGIHACVDYILHFPAVSIAAAALVGTAIGSSGRTHRALHHSGS